MTKYVSVMESYKDSNCNSLSDSFSLYERYMRSFNVVDSYTEENQIPSGRVSRCEYESSCEDNIDLSVNKHYEIAENGCNLLNPCVDNIDKGSVSLDAAFCVKIDEADVTSPSASLLDNSSATTANSLLTDKSYHTDVPVSSEDSKSNCFKQPVFITSTMENSNNAVDSVPLFRDVRPSESVFKLPISELSFNGTIKHVKKLKPIVDPITALTSSVGLDLDEKSVDKIVEMPTTSSHLQTEQIHIEKLSDTSSSQSNIIVRPSESTGDSQYEDLKKDHLANEESSFKWNEQSYSSVEASFDSGVRSPDMFSEDDEAGIAPAQEPFWSFLKDFEVYGKKRVKKLERTLQGILPPPSITTLKTDVTEMLKKYYTNLPLFEDKINPEQSCSTPTKRVAFIQIPDLPDLESQEMVPKTEEQTKSSITKDLDTSADRSINIQMCTEIEAREMGWPDVLKCRYHDVYYNLTNYSEKYEQLAMKYAERYVGAETDTSVNIYSGGLQSPSSASKRKAMRLKMAQAKSPGRRLSHLARRRQTFCSAATINERAHASTAKMVLIDKNYFPHRKLINSSDRRSPRTKRTPGKLTPTRKTPGKKTPSKTPKSSGKKRAMRRLTLDTDNVTRSQPRQAMIKRALFLSPEQNNRAPEAPSSVPLHAMKSKRALFGSPATAETKSSDGTQSDQFLKRKRDLMDDMAGSSRSKIAKSLSFGGDNIGDSLSHSFSRRASEVFATKNSVEFSETHKKKLLWAVSEALRVHGWRMSSPGFREKASNLFRLTRRLLALPPHRARLATPTLSTSETMLKLARQYVFAIIQGRTVEDCFEEEQSKIANDATTKITGYISAATYQQIKPKPTSTFTSQVKENFDVIVKQEAPRSSTKNVLQDKLNVDSNSNSSIGSMIDKSVLFKSNSMPSFEEAAKMRARRQISFDNVEFPKR